ncbi:MAG: hypothetical protein WBP45_09285, partial [Daejeonella sp.]
MTNLTIHPVSSEVQIRNILELFPKLSTIENLTYSQFDENQAYESEDYVLAYFPNWIKLGITYQEAVQVCVNSLIEKYPVDTRLYGSCDHLINDISLLGSIMLTTRRYEASQVRITEKFKNPDIIVLKVPKKLFTGLNIYVISPVIDERRDYSNLDDSFFPFSIFELVLLILNKLLVITEMKSEERLCSIGCFAHIRNSFFKYQKRVY